jgi:hypothetical protein
MQYNVWLRSVPGFYEQYSGKVTVTARPEEEAIAEVESMLAETEAFKQSVLRGEA